MPSQSRQSVSAKTSNKVRTSRATKPEKFTAVVSAAETEPESPYFSRAVSKALFILNDLNLSESALTLNEIATHASLTKSSCFRLLHTLEHLHYIVQSQDGRYAVPDQKWVSSSTQIVNAILRGPEKTARALNEEFRETVSIAVLFTNHIEVVQTFDSSRVLRMANTVGRILPPHASSLGKAITAFQPEAICKKLLVSYGMQRVTEHTIVDEVLLRHEFERIRKDGFAFEAEESTPDGCCFGAPIFVSSGGKYVGSPVAAISISMPKSRVPSGIDRTHMVSRLLEGATTLSRYLHTALLRQT